MKFLNKVKTKTKVIFKNVSQGVHKVKRFKSFINTLYQNNVSTISKFDKIL